MIENCNYEFSAIMWLWHGGKAAWSFISVPQDISDEIYFSAKLRTFAPSRGFGSIKVRATIGNSTWETSIFPSSETKCYILPIKKSVRLAEELDYDSQTKIKLRLI